MIKIRLKETMFEPGGLFHGTLPSRAVLHIGTGKQEIYLAKLEQVFGSSHPSFRGNQNAFLIDTTGTEISDDTLGFIMQNIEYQTAIGSQLLDYVNRDFIVVEQDGSALSAAALKAFGA